MMNAAAGELGGYWSDAAREAVRRAADLARRVLRAPVCLVYGAGPGGRTLRHVSGGPRHLAEAALHNPADDPADQPAPVERASLDVTIRSSRGVALGNLAVFDDLPRDWSAEDQAILTEMAIALGRLLELQAEVEHLRVPDAALPPLFPAIVDSMPGLVFERRKIDAAHCTYRFFGANKSTLPAVRQLMEGGASSPYSFVHRDDREKIRVAILRSTVEETDLDLTFRIKDFGDNLRWVRSQAAVRHEAGQAVWSGICVDITDLVAELESGGGPGDVPAGTGLADTAREARANGPVAGTRAASMPAVPPDSPARAAGPEKATAPPAPEAERQPGDGARILLADDLDLNRKLIADMLSLDGHLVDCVADGAAAVKAAAEKDYDLILMDMIMPGMDGIAATRAIRALPGPAGRVPIVALTAHSFREQLDSCLEAGMDATLTKPMTLDALTGAVTSWTRRRSQAA